MPRTNSRSLVFARGPQPGAAKTRLIPRLGAEGAAALHARLVEHTLAMAANAALGPLELHGTPAEDDFLRRCAARYGATFIAQREGDLGRRMRAALANALNESDCAVLIGTDCPALDAKQLRLAVRALAVGSDAVFAPTEDGGYALVGLARFDDRLFERIAWSTPRVMDETRARLRGLGWRWHELDTLWDVDRPADYERLVASALLEKPAAS
jgi:rSAM/selenodomain-associated transferase 1